LYLGDPELGTLSGHADVCPLQNLGTPRARVALNGQDYWLLRPVDLEPGRECKIRRVQGTSGPFIQLFVATKLFQVFQVHSSTEGVSSTREDADTEIVIVVQLGPRIVETAHALGVDGVSLLGAV